MSEEHIIPNHVGYIVDGNRRWAKQRGLPAYEGHLAGYSNLHDIASETFEQGVKYVSAYVFSTENWRRSQDEVGKLMDLVLKMLTTDTPILQKNNIRLLIVGSRENLKPKIIQAIEKAESETANNSAGTLALCFNYGGQIEIVDAVKKIVQSGKKPADISVKLIEDNLYCPDIPAVDLIVRTSGEQRISNFMLWRSAYSEMMFVEKMWPDLTKQDVQEILVEYSNRSRRFGG